MSRERIETEREMLDAIEFGRKRYAPKEAVLALRKTTPEDILNMVIFLVVIWYFMKGVGIVITPEMIIRILSGARVAPIIVQIVAPYVFHFYTWYILVSGLIQVALSHKKVFIPEWVYPLDATIHIICGTISFLYTGDVVYLLFFAGFLGVGNVVLYTTKYKQYRNQLIELTNESLRRGIRPPFSVVEAKELNLPQELIEKLSEVTLRTRGE